METASESAKRIAFLEGEHIQLCPLEPADAGGNYPAWLNDAEACAGNSHGRFPYTESQARDFIDDARGRVDRLVLAIVEKGAGVHVGNVALQSIDLLNCSCEFAILIGERQAWGKGYGKAALALLINHAFKELNMNRVYCGTLATNLGMQKLAKALGMQEEGRRRAAVYKGGEYVDVIDYGILRSEFDGAAG